MVAITFSNKPRSASKTGKGGAHWWKREVYHIDGQGGKTLCGRNTADWSKMEIEKLDTFCCDHCKTKYEPTKETPDKTPQ